MALVPWALMVPKMVKKPKSMSLAVTNHSKLYQNHSGGLQNGWPISTHVQGWTTSMDDVTVVHMLQNDVFLPKSYKKQAQMAYGALFGQEFEG